MGAGAGVYHEDERSKDIYGRFFSLVSGDLATGDASIVW
jgi:hypothetical protein